MLQGLDTQPISTNADFVPCECLGSPRAAISDGPPLLELVLVDATPPSSWELDDHTRQIGRRGIQMARQALLASTQRAAQ